MVYLLDLVRAPEGSVVQVHFVLVLMVMVVPEVRPVVVVAGFDDEEEVVADGCCETGIDCGVVDSATHSVVGELRSVPEPEFGTVGKMGHCRKIVLEVLLIEET